jgi:hypothetical protein
VCTIKIVSHELRFFSTRILASKLFLRVMCNGGARRPF